MARPKTTRFCEWCGESIKPHVTKSGRIHTPKRFCNSACFGKWNMKQRGFKSDRELLIGTGRYVEQPAPTGSSVKGPCWIWQGTLHPNYGYGQVCLQNPKRIRRAHRAAWELLRGPVPEGKDLHHHCEVKLCINPDHLEPLTQLEHGKYNHNSKKTHCAKGHEYTPENTIIRKTPSGTGRECRICHNETQQRIKPWVTYRERKRAAKLAATLGAGGQAGGPASGA